MGAMGNSEAANFVYLGLYALQHRGQDACGIVSIEDTDSERLDMEVHLHSHKGYGIVSDNFNRDILDRLPGSAAIGHVRYATHGGRLMQNIQPFTFRTPQHGPVVIAHNGNLTNAEILRKELENSGSIFSSTSDTEVFMHLIARSKAPHLKDRILEAMVVVKGAYSLVILTKDRMYAVRDPFGFRPLCFGKKEDTWIVASETCALDLLDVAHQQEVLPGQVVEFTKDSLKTHSLTTPKPKQAFCSFEPIYFSRPDSRMGEKDIYQLRKRMGEVLAEEYPTEADFVFAIPDSGVPMALGYSQASGIPLELGLIRNHYIGRTFIEPSQAIRDFGVKLKLNSVASVLRGKRVIVVDDSIVRGTTSVKIVRMLRDSGAKEIHFRVGSPPIAFSCFYGVSTPNREKLLAAQKNIGEIRQMLGADSIAYLSLKGLKKALGEESETSHCFACFSGNYPEEIFHPITPQPTDRSGPGFSSGL
jgi:amidophosphoribosyltransferase